MQTETISIDEFFNECEWIPIYKIKYYNLNDSEDNVNENCIYSSDGGSRCGYYEEPISSKDDVEKYDSLFLRPDLYNFVSCVVTDDDMVFCIIGNLFEEEDFNDYIVKSIAADPDKNMYDIFVEFML